MTTDNDSAATSTQNGAPLGDAPPPVGSAAPEGIDAEGEAPAAGPDGPGDVAAGPQAVPGVRPADPLDKSKPPESELEESKPPGSVPDYSTLALPEGTAPDDPLVAEALALFGEHRLPADAAQKLVDFAARRDKAVIEAQAGIQAQTQAQIQAKAHADAWAGVIRGWQAALLGELGTSTEFTGAAEGGDGLKEMQSLAARAIDAYGGADAAAIREHLKTYALGDHPAFARFLARAGRSVREDTLPRSGDVGGRLSTAQVLYGNTPSKE